MKKILLALFVLFVFIPAPASAADIRLGENVFLSANEYVADNMYVSGGQVTLSGTLARDAAVVGGRVIINGIVLGDVLAAGGTIDVLDRVSGDVRVLGGQVTVAGSVNGDLIIVGGNVHLLPGSVVSGDAIIVGGQLTVDGTINGATRLYGGDVTVNGLMGSMISIRAGNAVSFGDKAVIGSPLVYSSPHEALISEKAQLGSDITFHELDIPTRSLGPTGLAAVLAAVAGVIVITKLLSGIVAAIALVLVFPKFSIMVTDSVFQNFWKSVGVGFVLFIVIPAVIVVFAITIIGLLVAFAVGIAYAFLLIASGIYAGILTGSLIARRLKKENTVSWKWAALGAFVLFVISLLPFVGWVIAFVLFLAALGALGFEIYKQVLNGA